MALEFFSTDGFMPHGHCYLWKPSLVWLHTVSDGLTALAYFAIPFSLVYFARKRRDVPFPWMFLCFGAFIVACGLTHVMEIWTLWTPDYWASGLVKAVTAMASVPTAVLLAQLVPKALTIPTPAQLEAANAQLRQVIAERDAELAQRKRAEAELRAVNEELEAFSYSVAHDLRSPLRGIDGYATIIGEQSTGLDAKGREYLQRMRASTERMGELIDALLSLARVSRAEVHPEQVDVSAHAKSVCDVLAAGDPGRAVELIIAPGVTVRADPPLTRAMLENLLGNAWKFSSKVARPRIEVGRVGDELFVRDNGAGFDMAHAAKLFSPFSRLHTAGEFQGHGVGLATVKRIVERHGGSLRAEGKVGEGATFYVRLPS